MHRKWQVIQVLPYDDEENGSMHGIAVHRNDKTNVEKLYVTGSHKHLMEATLGAGGTLAWTRSILLPGPEKGVSHGMGIAVAKDGSRAYVCLSRNNTLAVVDLSAGKLVNEFPVGVCPYGIVLSPGESTAYVSNFGGRQPKRGDTTASSAGTPVVVESRGIARHRDGLQSGFG